jgi:hypothetical protein
MREQPDEPASKSHSHISPALSDADDYATKTRRLCLGGLVAELSANILSAHNQLRRSLDVMVVIAEWALVLSRVSHLSCNSKTNS